MLEEKKKKKKGMFRQLISLLRPFIKNQMEGGPVEERGAWYNCGRRILWKLE